MPEDVDATIAVILPSNRGSIGLDYRNVAYKATPRETERGPSTLISLASYPADASRCVVPNPAPNFDDPSDSRCITEASRKPQASHEPSPDGEAAGRRRPVVLV